MSIVQELTDLNAPSKVLEAGKNVEASLGCGLKPSKALVSFIRDWVGKHNSQNRWGK